MITITNPRLAPPITLATATGLFCPIGNTSNVGVCVCISMYCQRCLCGLFVSRGAFLVVLLDYSVDLLNFRRSLVLLGLPLCVYVCCIC